MVKQSAKFAGIRLFRFLTLTCILAFTSGCATRALMSSDRYEKPKPETQQYRSSDEISQSWHPTMIDLEQALYSAMAQENSHDPLI